MGQSDTPHPSHQVRLEVDILTDEFAVPAATPVLVMLVGADAALRGRVEAALAETPRHVLLEAGSVEAVFARLLEADPQLAQPMRALLG